MRLYQASVWAATAMNWHEPCFALDRSMPPSYLGRFRRKKKCLQCSLKTCRPACICCEWFASPHTRTHTPLILLWLRPVKYNTFPDTLISFVLRSATFSSPPYSKSGNGCTPLPCLLLPHPSSCSLTISQCKPTPALLASRNWGEHYSGALYRQQFCRVIIVYVGCILGDGCIPNEEFVTHFAEWTLWCPPRRILCFSSTSS